MPSPFPGMDPYLENPEFFPDLHDSLLAELKRALQAQLPTPYFAMIGSRVWVEYVERILEPDVSVLRTSPSAQAEARELFAEIYTVRGERRLVTALEVLSPSNKTPGAHSRGLYILKQREMLGSRVNLVEIDLLRGGVFSTAVPRDRAVQEAGPFDYHVCAHRFDDPERFYVYPILLQRRLPEIAVPLSPGDAPIVLDLQAAFDRAYDAGPYARINPYAGRAPEPPLPPDQAEWAMGLLRERDLLPPAA